MEERERAWKGSGKMLITDPYNFTALIRRRVLAAAAGSPCVRPSACMIQATPDYTLAPDLESCNPGSEKPTLSNPPRLTSATLTTKLTPHRLRMQWGLVMGSRRKNKGGGVGDGGVRGRGRLLEIRKKRGQKE